MIAVDGEMQLATPAAVLGRGRGERAQGRRGDRDARSRGLDGLESEGLEELARPVHLLDDVAAADELALDVELRNRRPGRVGLDALADVRGGEHVDRLVLGQHGIEDADDRRREAALWLAPIALHEEHHVARSDQLADLLSHALVETHRKSSLCWNSPAGRPGSSSRSVGRMGTPRGNPPERTIGSHRSMVEESRWDRTAGRAGREAQASRGRPSRSAPGSP